MNNEPDNEIDDLLKELKSTKSLGNLLPPLNIASTVQPIVDEDSINKFVMEKASLLIQQGIETSEDLKKSVKQSLNAEEIEAYSKLISAVATSIDVLNKINLQNKKDKTAKEIKLLDVESRKAIDSHITNNILIASREEIMKNLFAKAEEVVIDVDPNDIPDELKV